jgi:hypothetical protein
MFVSEDNWENILWEFDKKMNLLIYGDALGGFHNLLNEKVNKSFKNFPLHKYELYPFCDGDINNIDLSDDSNPEVLKIKTKAYNFSSTIPPCSNKVEYYTVQALNALIKKDKDIIDYLKKNKLTFKLKHRIEKTNEDSDYALEVSLEENGIKHIFNILGEHKATSYSDNGKCAAGGKIGDLIEKIKISDDKLVYKILFKVDTLFENGTYVFKKFFVGNFLTRIGMSAEKNQIIWSNNSAQIFSDCNKAVLVWLLQHNSLDDICNYIVNGYENKINKIKNPFFIMDNKEYVWIYNKGKNIETGVYGFYEIKRNERNIPYYTDYKNQNILLSKSTHKFKQYKEWTKITLGRKTTQSSKLNIKKTKNIKMAKHMMEYRLKLKQALLEQNPGIPIEKLTGIQRIIINKKPIIVCVSKYGKVETGRIKWKEKFYSEHPEFATIDNYKLAA